MAEAGQPRRRGRDGAPDGDSTIAQRLTIQRLTAQLLAGAPADGPVAVVERLLAVQAQDQRGARLAVRARTSGLSSPTIDPWWSPG